MDLRRHWERVADTYLRCYFLSHQEHYATTAAHIYKNLSREWGKR